MNIIVNQLLHGIETFYISDGLSKLWQNDWENDIPIILLNSISLLIKIFSVIGQMTRLSARHVINLSKSFQQ